MTPTESPSGGEVSFDNLYPALIECFAVILCGYVAGRLNIISATEAKGLNTFVGTFSLPSLIFMSMATLDLSSVNWEFLLAILLAKTSVFLVVLVITLLVTRPVDMSKSGLLAIFCTQSNDFALGYPIVAALYSQSHPAYPSYLYLMAPISLVILNPIAFLFMELGKRRAEMMSLALNPMNDSSNSNRQKPESTSYLILSILVKVLFNPVVFMTTLGIVGNLVFHQQLPIVLEGILKVFGSAFSAAALFLLGLRMVGQMHQFQGANLVIPCILICVKCLVLPIVTREFVAIIDAGADANETVDLSNFGFLYGTFPTAPGVFVYATHFGVDVDLVASAVTAGTFLSAPLMFISAKMLTLTNLSPSNYIQDLDSFLFDISIISLIATAWVIGIFIVGRKCNKIPHFFTLCLVISQFLGCFGVILWSSLGCCEKTWQLYLQFIFISLGVFGSRLWTALLALSLYFLRTRSLCFVLKLRPWFVGIGWGIPAIIATVLLSTVDTETDHAQKSDPNFQYGQTQAIVAVVILISSFLVTVTSLIMQQRYGKKYNEYQSLRIDDESDHASDPVPTQSTPPVLDIEDFGHILRRNGRARQPEETTGLLNPEISAAEDLPNASSTDLYSASDAEGGATEFCSSPNCDVTKQQQCVQIVKRYNSSPSEPEEAISPSDPHEEYQILRHIVLLLILSCSMFVGIALCMWTIIVERVSGIYLELLFFDGVLNYGQGFLVCMIFGFDNKLIVSPIMKRWRQFWDGAKSLGLPHSDAISPETKLTCEQFRTYHMNKCIADLVRDKRRRLKTYRSVFVGSDLVNWLIMVGLARDRLEAQRYGRHLVDGRVIKHIKSEYHFHDQPYFYTFLTSENTSNVSS
ncbi:integral membrane protein GPR155-like isoform X1 [Daphnia pulex]|uniref:integral membrane protein GPR155-like isoform X1 n=2 Tax=Daphnia pulex TaxID=6669 RepID=UPI001EDF7488|nr:integral membrane protein GPR155-like isoform X1 [Daphnia pulex]XP_046463584.1 integral membrane protein GPR155-like isoform X1 [Daphnia pulex]